ncbi:MAG: ATP-dependent Clp protease ATP-binding subunit ClpX, partial [Firmicutes bacterium]|nr:ATP-dependent Clp protease ATP-binding subunit ClpX [Bacillota bacterium]
DGVELDITEDALTAIAQEALSRKTGARGLRAILEEVMQEIMYDIPSRRDVKKCVITRETIVDKEPPRLVLVDRKVKKEEPA